MDVRQLQAELHGIMQGPARASLFEVRGWRDAWMLRTSAAAYGGELKWPMEVA